MFLFFYNILPWNLKMNITFQTLAVLDDEIGNEGSTFRQYVDWVNGAGE